MNRFSNFINLVKEKKVIVFLFFVISLLVFFIYYQKEKSDNNEESLKLQFIEQNNLRDELDDLIDEHDELLDEYGDLNNQLYQKDSLIKQQIIEIRKLIRNKNNLSNNLNEARTKINNLKRISQNYIKDIDSLFYVTERLSSEKDSVIKVNKNINWKNYKLNKTNIKLSEKVNKGSALKIKEISVEPFRYRGTGKEVSTRVAAKTQTLRACFYIAANLIAEAGKKEILIQYINPQEKIISGSDTIVNEQQVIFSAKTDIQYNNKKSFVCIDWQRYVTLVEGDYQLKIYINNTLTAETQFNLR